MKILYIGFLLLLASLYSCNGISQPNYHFVDIKGKKQHVLTLGKGEPVVVFISGGGSDLEDFEPVQKEISKITKTISYDKLGIGKSELADSPRTLENVSMELRELIKKEGILKSPIILVGHSMGGFVARYYLRLYPDNVKGLILIDPGSEYLEDEWRKIRTEKQLKSEDSLLTAQIKLIPEGFKMEVFAYPQHDSILRTFDIDTDIPVVLMESNMFEKGDESDSLHIELQKRLYREFVATVPQTRLISTKKSGHFIQLDEPDLVIEAIEDIIQKVQ
ncbi:alpha/beta fold hydrolase [Flagellimonas maritima]|nr:alpha/beta hydrolase [Allomuricauda aurantiaca]